MVRAGLAGSDKWACWCLAMSYFMTPIMSFCRYLPRYFDDGTQAALNEIFRPCTAKHADCILSCAMAWSNLADAQCFQTLDNRLDPGITAAAQVKPSHPVGSLVGVITTRIDIRIALFLTILEVSSCTASPCNSACMQAFRYSKGDGLSAPAHCSPLTVYRQGAGR